MKLRWILPLLLFASLVEAKTLERGNGPEPSTLDAHRCPEVACANILRDLYEGLVMRDARGALIPGMAERWELLPDGRHYRFYLRKNLRWSNGDALTAAQIVESFQRAFLPETAAPFAVHFFAIENAEAIQAGHSPATSLGVKAIDANTIEFTLTRSVDLLQLLTLPLAFPVNTAAVKQHGAQHTRPENLVANGAYRLKQWTPQANLILERNPFFREKPAIETVRFHVTEDASSELQRYQAGGLHITEALPPQPLENYQKRFGSQLRISPYLGSFWLGLNLEKPPMKNNRALREALSLAIDRDILTRYITGLGETPAYAVVPPGMPGYQNVALTFSKLSQAQRVQRAKQLYQQAGYSDEKPLDIEIRYNTSTPHRRLALAVAAMWRENLGARVRLRNEEWKVFVSNRKQRVITQVFRGGWIADVPDAANFLSNFESGGATNWSGYNDAQFNQLMQRAQSAATPEQRNALLQQAEIRLLGAHALVPIYFYSSKHLVHPDVVGFEANALDQHPTRFLRWRQP